MRVWKAFDTEVRSLAFAPDGAALAVGGLTGVKLFDTRTGQGRWSAGEKDGFARVAFTPDGWAVVALVGMRLLVLDAATGREAARHSRRIGAFAVPAEPGELLVLTAGHDIAEFRRLNLHDGEVYWKKPLRYHGGVTRMALSPDGRTVGTVGSWEALLLDVESRAVQFVHRMRSDEGRPAALAFSPDGGAFVFAERSTLRACRTDSLDPSAAVPTEGPAFRDLAFRRDGKALLAVRAAAAVEERSAETWEPTRAFDWKAGRLGCVAVSPDGALAAAGSDSGKVVVWDLDL